MTVFHIWLGCLRIFTVEPRMLTDNNSGLNVSLKVNISEKHELSEAEVKTTLIKKFAGPWPGCTK